MVGILMLYFHRPLPRGYGLDAGDKLDSQIQQQGAERDWPIPEGGVK